MAVYSAAYDGMNNITINAGENYRCIPACTDFLKQYACIA